MFSLKSILFFLLGILVTASSFFIYKRVMFFVKDSKTVVMQENVIRSPLEFATKIYHDDGIHLKLPSKGSNAFVPSKMAIKTNIGIYNQSSTCFIDVATNADFNEKSNGKPNYVRIVISDPSSFESRNECIKIAMDNIFPFVLNDGYANVIKSKVYEEGTISKQFTRQQLEDYAKTSKPILFDGGFLFESLNVGLLSTPIVFEIHITDCNNVKCGE